MHEYAIEGFARDARLLTVWGGTSEIDREIMALPQNGVLPQ